MSENKKLGQGPAFPTEPIDVVIGRTSCNITDENGREQILYQNQFGKEIQSGMSKRFYAACAAMQGLCSNPHVVKCGELDLAPFIGTAYKMADELLKQEIL